MVRQIKRRVRQTNAPLRTAAPGSDFPKVLPPFFTDIPDPLQGHVQIFQYLCIGKSDHLNPQRFQTIPSRTVPFPPIRQSMYWSIHLYNQAQLVTIEVSNAECQGMLATEFPAIQLPCAQLLPKPLFSGGHIFAQFCRDSLQFRPGTEMKIGFESPHDPP